MKLLQRLILKVFFVLSLSFDEAGNPLASWGCWAVMRCARIRNGDQRRISLISCNVSNACSLPVNFYDPSGSYALQMEKSGDRAVAAELWELCVRDGTLRWRDVKLGGRRFVVFVFFTESSASMSAWTNKTLGCYLKKGSWSSSMTQKGSSRNQ